jgi:hypothetical protein
MASSTAADRSNDGALGATRDVRLKAGFTDALNDVFDLLFGGAVRHVDDHDGGPFLLFQKAAQKRKAAILSRL